MRLFDDSLEEYTKNLRSKGQDGMPLLILLSELTEWIGKIEANKNNDVFSDSDKKMIEAAFIAGWCARERQK